MNSFCVNNKISSYIQSDYKMFICCIMNRLKIYFYSMTEIWGNKRDEINKIIYSFDIFMKFY